MAALQIYQGPMKLLRRSLRDWQSWVGATYSVSVWDHDDEDFLEVAAGLNARRTIAEIRGLERQGYDRDCSIYVSREA